MNIANKYVCIHGHFYQPPRENAWLEVIEQQLSAAPFHDWNERINFECYALNAAARILDEGDYIKKILNNYGRISFNMGPTLLSWLEQADPATYQAILNADKLSQVKFGRHGSAIAQVYSHLIMPLANLRDKQTQVAWGISDFEHRFGRRPEGMWLAETAVDTETLEVLAEHDIRYTILAPRQAKSVRQIGDKSWKEVSDASVDTRRPYLCQLPSGRSIVLFFYHGPHSQGVAFDGYLNSGKTFAERLSSSFSDDDSVELVHIATDGESYGHHHKHGEMALADCLHYIEEQKLATLVNYGFFLEKYPPQMEAAIHENSSWSCVHGVERWRSNCGCHSGAHPSWDQKWRKPLREILDWLREEIIPLFEQEASSLLKDPWAARNDYIRVVLDRREKTIQDFFRRHRRKKLKKSEQTRVLRLLEMQRHAMLMYTSCGWFFDEISGIETLQILQYANRVIYYARQLGAKDLHEAFLDRLSLIPSNVFLNAEEAYRRDVMPARVDLKRVGMHYAVSSIFEKYPERLEFFNYVAQSEVFERETAGNQRLALGRTTVKSDVSLSEKQFSFAVLYLGQQNIIGNISTKMDRETFDEMSEQMLKVFRDTNLGGVIGLMQQYFGPEKFTMWHLFRDQKQKILKEITDQNLVPAEMVFREIYNDNYQLMTGMKQNHLPIPNTYRHAVQFSINKDLYHFFENGVLYDVKELKRLVGELKKWEVELSNSQSFQLVASERLYQELTRLDRSEASLDQLENLIAIVETIEQLGLKLDIWKSQNLYFSMIKGYKNEEWVFANERWENAFYRLGELLKVRT